MNTHDIQSSWLLPPDDEINRLKKSNPVQPDQKDLPSIDSDVTEFQTHPEKSEHDDVNRKITSYCEIERNSKGIKEEPLEIPEEKCKRAFLSLFAVSFGLVLIIGSTFASRELISMQKSPNPPTQNITIHQTDTNRENIDLKGKIKNSETKINQLNEKLKTSQDEILALKNENAHISQELKRFESLISENTSKINTIKNNQNSIESKIDGIIVARNADKNKKTVSKKDKPTDALINQVNQGIDNVLSELN
ncbi:hypothetical protein [Photobacterium damselae]|uniref:hypothetical protein n=1 Tax=Photobacterium damselae TaxID=38293 RepID=UPI0040692D43